ncbi:Vacuolar protein sorting-associated protein 16 [Liparis tanakae]|uniref:Vacuolar protein sorting-associated protein 16 homolog n=1 Tax=Liparis tanakae TaxID=230148 RepID=A0A4Z2F7U0_9TELE|nr:Vacuolar protein sorting-associated protein 16 [Liparis tanakae]
MRSERTLKRSERTLKRSENRKEGKPSCWVVLNQDRQTKVLLSNGPEIYILDSTSCTAVVRHQTSPVCCGETPDLTCLLSVHRPRLFVVTEVQPQVHSGNLAALSTPQCPPGLGPQAGSIVHMAVSFRYKYLALFTDSGHLWTGPSHLQDKMSEVDTKKSTPPKQMVWYVYLCHLGSIDPGHLGSIDLFHLGSIDPGHLGSMDPGHLGSIDLFHLGSIDPGHLGSMDPGHLGSMVPGHLGSIDLGHLGSIDPGHLGSIDLFHLGSIDLCHLGSIDPGHLGSMDPGHLGSIDPGHLGSIDLFHLGSIDPGHLGSMDPGHLGSIDLGHLGSIDPGHLGSIDLFHLGSIDPCHLGSMDLLCRRPKSQQPSVVLMWDRLLLVAGVCNDTIQFPTEDKCVLVGELDGVRIISSANQELLQEVPLAASFGKCFLSDFSPALFLNTCRELRVLNAVRESGVGLPLTHTQYPDQFYPLAIEMCRYLKIPDYQGVSRVLKHWASCKVQQKDLSDEAIARTVCVKVGDSPGVSYSHIAAKAYECGRTELAIKLLDFEARSGEQVPLLLKMKRSQLALSKAVESGDTDLVYTVVTYLKNEMNRGDFFMTLRNQPVALSLYRQVLFLFITRCFH